MPLQSYATAFFALLGFLLTAPGANANPYVAIDLGAAFLEEADTDMEGEASGLWPDGQASGGVTYDVGWVVGGAAGWVFGDNRVELSIVYGHNSSDRLELDGVVMEDAPGRTKMALGFANVYWDIPLEMGFRPYLGAGVGLAWVNFMTNTSQLGAGFYINDRQIRAAGNFMVGIGVPIGDRLVVDLGYRFTLIQEAEFESDVQPGLAQVELDMLFRRHDLTLGLRYSF